MASGFVFVRNSVMFEYVFFSTYIHCLDIFLGHFPSFLVLSFSKLVILLYLVLLCYFFLDACFSVRSNRKGVDPDGREEVMK